MPQDVRSLLAALRSGIPGSVMTIPERLNDIANTMPHLNNMDLSPQTRNYFLNKITGHYSAMGADLPSSLKGPNGQGYDLSKSLNNQVAPPPPPSEPVRLGNSIHTVPPRPWQIPWPETPEPRQVKRVLKPTFNPEAAIGASMLPNATGGGSIKRPFEEDTE